MRRIVIYPVGRYNLNFDISAIILCVFLLVYLIVAENLRVRRIRAYFGIVACMLVCTVGELAMDIARNDNGITFTNAQAEVATFFAHITHYLLPLMLVLYFLALTGIWHELKKRDIVLITVPEIALVLCHIIPPIRQLFYYYTGACEYVRGPLYAAYYAVVAFYVVCGLAILIKNRSAVDRRSVLCIFVMGGGCLIGMVVGLADPYLRISNFIQALVIGSTFLLLQDENSMLDKVMGVYNTAALNRDVFPLLHFSYETYILSIKLQDLNEYRLMVGMHTMTQVLRQIGAWMLKRAGEDCRFYRVGTGEFAVLLFKGDKNQAESLAEQVRDRFVSPWHYSDSGAGLTIPVQVWISSIPNRISTEEQVLAFSEAEFDTNLPQDQVFVANEMEEENRRAQVNVAIRRAIANDRFEVYYQPIYDTAAGKIRSCEALVRMTDEELGPVSPEEFIKVAEHTGTISTVGAIVFEKVCAFIAEQQPSRYGVDFVEVNLSPIQCMDQNLVSKLTAIMERYGVRPEQIVLEITESAVIRNHGRVDAIIQGLHDAGFKFALDDFGTGEANYSYVRDYPFSIIKIDKSFLWAADDDLTDRAVLHSMLGLVKDLHLKALVEGIETERQRDGLIADGVDYLQGYLYSKPVPADRFLAGVRDFNGLQG